MPNPLAVRVGPGILKIAPLGTAVPVDLATAWAAAWVDLGYTEEGSNFVFDTTFEDVTVAEEYDPVQVLQTARSISINFSLAEMTALNMQRALNGGSIVTGAIVTTFEPPAAGVMTYMMLGWQADDNLERWAFRKVLQVGSIDIPRKKAPDKAQVPMSFRAVKPATGAVFTFIHDIDWA